MEIIRRAADLKCSGNLQASIQIIDGLLRAPITRTAIKSLFGVAALEHDEDFVSLIEVVRMQCDDFSCIDIMTAISPPSDFGKGVIGTRLWAARAGMFSVLRLMESSRRALQLV